MDQPQPRSNWLSCYLPMSWPVLGWSILLTGCVTPFGATQPDSPLPPFQLLPPSTLERPVTVLQKLDSRRGDNNYHWETVLNVDADRIYLVILGPLGQRLATLSFNGQHLAVDRNGPIRVGTPLKNILGELQIIFWPLAMLNTSKWNRDWYFEEQKHIRYVYYQQRLVAEIHRRSSSPWTGDFDYISKVSDYRLTIRSRRLDQ